VSATLSYGRGGPPLLTVGRALRGSILVAMRSKSSQRSVLSFSGARGQTSLLMLCGDRGWDGGLLSSGQMPGCTPRAWPCFAEGHDEEESMIFVVEDDDCLHRYSSLSEIISEVEALDAETVLRAVMDEHGQRYRIIWLRPNKRDRCGAINGVYGLVPDGEPDLAGLREMVQNHQEEV
jgi:hypothetical protein